MGPWRVTEKRRFCRIAPGNWPTWLPNPKRQLCFPKRPYQGRAAVRSGQERRPGRVRRIARSRHALFVIAGNIDGEELWPGIAAGVAEKHDHAPVRSPGRAFIVIALGENTLARAIDAHDSDGERARAAFGESDHVAARRPHRRRVIALAEGKPALAGAV